MLKMELQNELSSASLLVLPAHLLRRGLSDCRLTAVSSHLISPAWKIMEMFSANGRGMRAASKVLDDFAYGVIAQREAEGMHTITEKGMGAKDAKKDLLSLYMALRDANGKPMNRTALR